MLLKAKLVRWERKKKNYMKFRKKSEQSLGEKKIQIKYKKWPFSPLRYKVVYVTAMSSVSSPTCFAFNFREPRLRERIGKTELNKHF